MRICYIKASHSLLEPYEGKLSCTVLRGESPREGADLLDSVTNEIVQKERFRYFIKVPELAAFYAQITDYRTAKDIGIDRPEKNEIMHNIPPTPDAQRCAVIGKQGLCRQTENMIYETDSKYKSRLVITTGRDLHN